MSSTIHSSLRRILPPGPFSLSLSFSSFNSSPYRTGNTELIQMSLSLSLCLSVSLSFFHPSSLPFPVLLKRTFTHRVVRSTFGPLARITQRSMGNKSSWRIRTTSVPSTSRVKTDSKRCARSRTKRGCRMWPRPTARTKVHSSRPRPPTFSCVC